MIELRYHHALPDMVKIVGLDIRPIAECEGGGYMVPKKQGELLRDSYQFDKLKKAYRLKCAALCMACRGIEMLDVKDVVAYTNLVIKQREVIAKSDAIYDEILRDSK
ncbi:MAG: hypothetical protein JEY79_01195 [Pseudodesulfovibrio sp.]|nr:hypothetical protein [Pseudodesulfovibrio sp.]